MHYFIISSSIHLYSSSQSHKIFVHPSFFRFPTFRLSDFHSCTWLSQHLIPSHTKAQACRLLLLNMRQQSTFAVTPQLTPPYMYTIFHSSCAIRLWFIDRSVNFLHLRGDSTHKTKIKLSLHPSLTFPSIVRFGQNIISNILRS